MAGLNRFDDTAWDRFFEFVTPDVVHMPIGEVDAELKSAGLDVEPMFRRVQAALESKQAREALERARKHRPCLTQQVVNLVVSPIKDAREIVHQMISKVVPTSQQTVYFSKLEQAASPDDLSSLLEDIQRLECLDLGEQDGQR